MVHDIRDREIRINSDAGRICRPLIVVDNGKLAVKRSHIDKLKEREYCNFTWSDLVAAGVVEFIDVNEEGWPVYYLVFMSPGLELYCK